MHKKNSGRMARSSPMAELEKGLTHVRLRGPYHTALALAPASASPYWASMRLRLSLLLRAPPPAEGGGGKPA